MTDKTIKEMEAKILKEFRDIAINAITEIHKKIKEHNKFFVDTAKDKNIVGCEKVVMCCLTTTVVSSLEFLKFLYDKTTEQMVDRFLDELKITLMAKELHEAIIKEEESETLH